VENIRVENRQLLGRIRFAAAGVSARIDELWALVKAGVLKAVSVGFTVADERDIEPIRGPDNRVTGFRFLRQELLELSLVTVPANPNALAVAKSLVKDPRAYLHEVASMENETPAPAAPAPTPEPAAPPRAAPEPPRVLRRVAGNPARPSEGLTRDIVRAFNATGSRANFATIGSMADVARVRSFVNSGGLVAVPGGTTATVVPADVRTTLLLDLIGFEPRGPGKISVSVIGYAANNAAVVAEGAAKPQSDFSVTPKEISHVKVAHWTCVTDEELDDIPGLRAVIDEELVIGLLAKVDTQVVLARIVAGATAYTPGAGSSLVDNAAAMLATLTSRGETGARVVANPMDLAGALTAKDSEGRYLTYPPQILAGISASPTVPTGKLLGFAPRGIAGYEREAETVVMGLKNDDLIKNQKTILAEWRGNAAIVIPAIVLYGDAVGAAP
jgi:HK97 family phage major capsid protein